MYYNNMHKKILFIGDLSESSRSLQRFRTLKEMGCEVMGLSYTPLSYRPGIDDKDGLFSKILWKLGWPRDKAGINEKAIEAVRRSKFDIVWIDKCLVFRPESLKLIRKKIPSIKLVWCSEDDMYASHNQSRFFLRGIGFYDVIFTTKVYNLAELKKLGARRTEFFLDAYDEKVHRPMVLTEEEKKKFSCDVGFIGTFEKERADSIIFLAEHGIQVVVWGNGWDKLSGCHPNLIIKGESLYGDDYPKAINATKINLNFLRKINRDEVTSRSIEIPACGGFMLAERSKRHLDFFEDNKEAVFFSSLEELLNLVKIYLADDIKRNNIAKAGRARCIISGYNHRSQLETMLEKIDSTF